MNAEQALAIMGLSAVPTVLAGLVWVLYGYYKKYKENKYWEKAYKEWGIREEDRLEKKKVSRSKSKKR